MQDVQGRRCPRPLGAVLVAAAWLGACGGSGGGTPFVFSGAPPASVSLGTTYAYQPALEGAPGPVELELVEGPPGLTLSEEGLLSWTPEYADLGAHPIELRATSGELAASQSWSLRVDQGLVLGVAVSPRGHESSTTEDDWIDHFSEHPPYGKVLALHTNWRDSLETSGELPGAVATMMVLSLEFGFTPMIGLGWSDGAGNPDLASADDPDENSFLNPATRQQFLDVVAETASWHPPRLFIGNETNSYYVTHSQAEWDAWVAVFEESYDLVKAISPTTQVSTVLQLEKALGLGALAGWSDPAHLAELIDDHALSGKIDAFAFTTYPHLEHPSPADMPADYYADIALHWSGPVLFTEVAWPATAGAPYFASETLQAAFVPRFFELTRELPLVYATWIFLHDWDGEAGTPGFEGIGLRSNDGAIVRPADAAWRAEVNLRQVP